jgi:hypothetical protein
MQSWNFSFLEEFLKNQPYLSTRAKMELIPLLCLLSLWFLRGGNILLILQTETQETE